MIIRRDMTDVGGGGVGVRGGCPLGRTLDNGKGQWGGKIINM